MSTALAEQRSTIDWTRPLPLLTLLHPREYTPAMLAVLGLGIVGGWAGMQFLGWKLWMAAAFVIIVLLPIYIGKWRADRVRYGAPVMLLSILLTTQGAHTIEHIIQWVQYHGLYWTARQSNGLLSPANAEWVHFIWNWWVLITVVILLRSGMRNPWAYVLLAITIAHTFEHTYTFIRYQQVLAELRELGVPNVTAQGLPGILGRDGWLARSIWTRGTVFCSVPGLTTAPRLDVHFWWNVIEMSFLALAGHVFLRQSAVEPTSTPSEPYAITSVR